MTETDIVEAIAMAAVEANYTREDVERTPDICMAWGRIIGEAVVTRFFLDGLRVVPIEAV